MPYSEPSLKGWSLDFYKAQQPKCVLDIGAGSGTYAKMFRNHHPARWIAVEAWGPYIEQFNLSELYDDVIIADVRYLSAVYLMADMVILGDVIEHMPKIDAIDVVNQVKKFSDSIIASIPVGDWPQGSVNGVPTEEHLATWEIDEIESLFIGADIRVENRVAVAHWVNK